MSSKLRVQGFMLSLLGWFLFPTLFTACNSAPTISGTTKKTDKSGIAKFVFSEEIHNFGSLKAGEIVSYTFVFRNDGTKTLTISGIDSGCGCTEVRLETKIILPGQEGRIEVIYNSAGEVGRQLKTITLFSNADKPEKQIFIRANVINDIIEINS